MTQPLIFSANKQPTRVKKILGCMMQQTCSISPLMKPLERNSYQALKKVHCKSNRLATYCPWEIKAMIIVVLLSDV